MVRSCFILLGTFSVIVPDFTLTYLCCSLISHGHTCWAFDPSLHLYSLQEWLFWCHFHQLAEIWFMVGCKIFDPMTINSVLLLLSFSMFAVITAISLQYMLPTQQEQLHHLQHWTQHTAVYHRHRCDNSLYISLQSLQFGEESFGKQNGTKTKPWGTP